jgi:hypothetical protein
MDLIAKRDRKLFLEVNDIKHKDNFRYLMYLNYIMSTRSGFCYDLDLAYLLKTEKSKLPLQNVRRRLYSMKMNGLVDYVKSEDLHPILKRRYIITDKGKKCIDNYIRMMNRKQKDINYLLKKIRKEATE